MRNLIYVLTLSALLAGCSFVQKVADTLAEPAKLDPTKIYITPQDGVFRNIPMRHSELPTVEDYSCLQGVLMVEVVINTADIYCAR